MDQFEALWISTAEDCLFRLVVISSRIERSYCWQLLGRSIDLTFLIGQRMNKIFRENLDFLFERFEAHDLCSIVVHVLYVQLLFACATGSISLSFFLFFVFFLKLLCV